MLRMLPPLSSFERFQAKFKEIRLDGNQDMIDVIYPPPQRSSPFVSTIISPLSCIRFDRSLIQLLRMTTNAPAVLHRHVNHYQRQTTTMPCCWHATATATTITVKATVRRLFTNDDDIKCNSTFRPLCTFTSSTITTTISWTNRTWFVL